MSDTEKAQYYIIYTNGTLAAVDDLPTSFPHMCDTGLIKLVIDTERRTYFVPQDGLEAPQDWLTVTKHVNA